MENHKKIVKKNIEELRIDNIPIWWLLEPLIKQPYLPNPIKTLDKIENIKDTNKFVNNLFFKLKTFSLRKCLFFNERVKLIISKKNRNISRGDILFPICLNQYYNEEIIEKLNTKGLEPLIIIYEPISRNSFFKLKKFKNLLYTYVDTNIINKSKKIAVDIHQKWKKIDEDSKRKFFIYDKKYYWDFMKNEINFLFSKEILFILILYYLTFKKIIRNVELIYLNSVIGFYELSIIGASYTLNKKIIYSHHGYLFRYPLLKDELMKNFLFIVNSTEEKKRLINFGITKRKIFIIGSPFFDNIVKYKIKATSLRNKIVTLITQPLIEDRYIEKKEYFNYIKKFLIEINNIKYIKKIIIKLHPREKFKSKYEAIVKSLNFKNIKIIQTRNKDNLYSIIGDSSVIISFGSTVDIESLMLDKNIIIIDGLKERITKTLKKDEYRKACLVINKNDDLGHTINNILNNKKLQSELKEKRKKYLEKNFYRPDGKASERLVNLIYKFLKN